MIHDLKTWPSDFDAILSGTKTHEARKADRPFKVGDTLRLREWKSDRIDASELFAFGVKTTGTYTRRRRHKGEHRKPSSGASWN
jgi:hypothetical protein